MTMMISGRAVSRGSRVISRTASIRVISRESTMGRCPGTGGMRAPCSQSGDKILPPPH